MFPIGDTPGGKHFVQNKRMYQLSPVSFVLILLGSINVSLLLILPVLFSLLMWLLEDLKLPVWLASCVDLLVLPCRAFSGVETVLVFSVQHVSHGTATFPLCWESVWTKWAPWGLQDLTLKPVIFML